MNKKIKKWEPDNFELELNSVWSFKERGDWATHDAKWRGNWSPYIPRNLILRYTNEKDLILDQFIGGGTTLVEAKLLNRNIIGIDVNDVAIERCKEKIDFEFENSGKVYIHKGDARKLNFIKNEKTESYIDVVNLKTKQLEEIRNRQLSNLPKGTVIKNIEPIRKWLREVTF